VSKNDRLSENKSVALATLDALAKGELDKLDICVEAKSFMTTRTGKDYRNEYHTLFKIRGGKVLSVKEYSDTKHVMDTFF
jgi:ketosteroid isomerase-like protein